MQPLESLEIDAVPARAQPADARGESLADASSLPAVQLAPDAGATSNATRSEPITCNTAPPAIPPLDESVPQFLWLRRGDQIVVGLLALAAALLLAVHVMRASRWGISPVVIERPEEFRYEFRIDINQASWIEWSQLDGIGETLARRIVADRATRGPFKDLDDLLRVNGIGHKKLAQLRPWLECSHAETPLPDGAR